MTFTIKWTKHYHLEVQANPKKIVQKTDGINSWHFFFEFSLRPLEVVEAEGGRLVKEADFEAEKKIY